MLDDLKYIHQRDAQDALGVAEKQWHQLLGEFRVDWQPPGPIYNVVLAGMGGSALVGDLIKVWPGLSEPFEVVRGYDLPAYVDHETLVIASSYSGNTEETLSALDQALGRKAQVVVIASGGKESDLARARGLPLIHITRGWQPRMALLSDLAALVDLLASLKLVPKESIDELRLAAEFLKTSVSAWRADVPTKDNYAKQLALEVIGKSAVIYSGPKLFPAAYKWKIDFNENAKHIAWCNQYPEFNHNEFLGWTAQPVDKPYAVIELRSNLEHPRVQKRFEVTERLLSGKRPAPMTVNVEGKTILEQLLWAFALGDFVSVYTALLNGVNPTPVELIEKFKASMAA